VVAVVAVVAVVMLRVQRLAQLAKSPGVFITAWGGPRYSATRIQHVGGVKE